jgi:hypothetical protein
MATKLKPAALQLRCILLHRALICVYDSVSAALISSINIILCAVIALIFVYFCDKEAMMIILISVGQEPSTFWLLSFMIHTLQLVVEINVKT